MCLGLLGYYEGDYSDIGEITQSDYFIADVTGSKLLDARNDLFNGDIGMMVTTVFLWLGVPPPTTESSQKI
jgi:hypothetical protein